MTRPVGHVPTWGAQAVIGSLLLLLFVALFVAFGGLRPMPQAIEVSQ